MATMLPLVPLPAPPDVMTDGALIVPDPAPLPANAASVIEPPLILLPAAAEENEVTAFSVIIPPAAVPPVAFIVAGPMVVKLAPEITVIAPPDVVTVESG